MVVFFWIDGFMNTLMLEGLRIGLKESGICGVFWFDFCLLMMMRKGRVLLFEELLEVVRTFTLREISFLV